jgi:DNA polymerase elongation subunit (family B)
MYPNILTKWDLLSRQVDKNGCKAFAGMVQTRMDIKEKLLDKSLSKEEKKKLKDQSNRYKLILNTTSGCMKDKFKKLYDPEYNTKMCMLGQLSLMDLVFRLKNAKRKPKPAWALPSEGSLDKVASEPREYFRLIQLTQWLK